MVIRRSQVPLILGNIPYVLRMHVSSHTLSEDSPFGTSTEKRYPATCGWLADE